MIVRHKGTDSEGDDCEPLLIHETKSQGCKCTCDMKDERTCDHKWDGPHIEFETEGGSVGSSVTCSVCGADAMSHDMWLI